MPDASNPHDPVIERLETAAGGRTPDAYVDAEELGLTPTRPLDLARCRDVSDLLEAMRDTSFGGRQLGEAADVFEAMVRDPECLVVGTFSGAMTVAKQGLVLCDMIDHGLVDVIVSTGALMTHGLIEAAGMRHFKVRPDLDDRQMYYAGLDRVYDTLELEANLDDLEMVLDEVLWKWPEGQTASSAAICRALGAHLEANVPGRGIVKSALARDVPIFIPAFTDSELGLDFAIHNRRRRNRGAAPLAFDPFLDLEAYTERVAAASRIGIFTIGGGVPRNWAQQVSPYLDLLHTRAGAPDELRRFRYGVRICPEPVHWGGLSGCTYAEGVSWGKFIPAADGGRFAEVPADATIAWPLLVKGVLQRLDRPPVASSAP
ncbi:MAG: deoxyhypusine synthase family protein [Myxococcota bacterium]